MRSVVACVSDQQRAMQPSGHVADIPYAMTFGRTFGVSEPVPLRSKAGGPSGLMLDIFHPNLHVSAALTAQVSATMSQHLPLDKRRAPTGFVTPADVVRLLIAEFGIAERRRDWPARLARAERAIRLGFPSPGPAVDE